MEMVIPSQLQGEIPRSTLFCNSCNRRRLSDDGFSETWAWPPSTFRNSGVRSQQLQELQESENLGAWRRFFQGDAGPGFSDKDLARVFCLLNS